MSADSFFVNPIANMGDISPNQVVKVVWELKNPEEGENKPVHFQPDCGCTANTHMEGNKVVAEFTEKDAKNLNDTQKAEWYPSGKMPVTKGITVFFNDGKDLHIADPNSGRNSFNPDKKSEKITFIGYVVLKQPVIQ